MNVVVVLVTKSCLTLLWPHGLKPIRILCPQDFPSKNTGVGCYFLLRGIYPPEIFLQRQNISQQTSLPQITSARVRVPCLSPHANGWLIGKDFDAGRYWGQEKKETTEDEMAGWHPWLDGCEPEWTPGVGDGQGGLACCDSWGCKESDSTEGLNWTAG